MSRESALTDCPVCGGAAVVSFGKAPMFAGMKSNGWGERMGYTARCNFSDCKAPTYTRESADAAGAAWNNGVMYSTNEVSHER